ncbi:hypothetical protein HBH64_124120 [Parastagonospora nodorum]|nr:hypothetical protein HBI01_195350 [Parastagonospora nodorum]KAH4317694.1 hypothetical protein HBI02_019590 [Parastagonospora nodorum]KAH4327092.1 hypothetical protein HBI00_136080 [Parastagonospora nodorum]KAH4393143.1 hypothetical protein HBH94_007960 [Parastagonospora nodorum]KAH4420194.1 hypothetical protein HBH92_030960 [Parastagonospora nodorum]
MSTSSETSFTAEAEVEQSTLMITTTISSALPPIVTSPSLFASQAFLLKRSSTSHTIKVGPGTEFKFEPAVLPDVLIGDVISFEFYPKGHSVARADFEKPCVPYESNGANRDGFWSGEQMIETGTSNFDVSINSTEPVFFYCAAKDSCHKHLMVGVINPNETQTLDKQIQAANMTTHQLAPGESIPLEGGFTTSDSPIPGGSTSTPRQADASHDHSHGLSTAAIVGISVGAGAFLVVCAALFFFVGRLKSLKELIRHHGQGSTAKPQGVGGVHPEPDYRQSTFSQSPQSPQGEYPPAFGRPLPAYAGPHINMKRMPSHNDRKSSQPMAAELHSPTLGRQGFSAELEASNVSSKGHG